MAPCEKILATAVSERADYIGLSGLITPSLNEMVHVAGEMQRRGLRLPLLIGGATTSPRHTALKIDPAYEGAVIYVKDASRAVRVMGRLSGSEREAYLREVATDLERRRGRPSGVRRREDLLSLEAARANRVPIDWRAEPPIEPACAGRIAEFAPSLDELYPYIDWQPYFAAWEIHGKFPDLLEDAEKGQAARELLRDLHDSLIEPIRAGGIAFATAGVAAIFPAAASGDDIVSMRTCRGRRFSDAFTACANSAASRRDGPTAALRTSSRPRGGRLTGSACSPSPRAGIWTRSSPRCEHRTGGRTTTSAFS